MSNSDDLGSQSLNVRNLWHTAARGLNQMVRAAAASTALYLCHRHHLRRRWRRRRVESELHRRDHGLRLHNTRMRSHAPPQNRRNSENVQDERNNVGLAALLKRERLEAFKDLR